MKNKDVTGVFNNFLQSRAGAFEIFLSRRGGGLRPLATSTSSLSLLVLAHQFACRLAPEIYSPITIRLGPQAYTQCARFCLAHFLELSYVRPIGTHAFVSVLQ